MIEGWKGRYEKMIEGWQGRNENGGREENRRQIKVRGTWLREKNRGDEVGIKRGTQLVEEVREEVRNEEENQWMKRARGNVLERRAGGSEMGNRRVGGSHFGERRAEGNELVNTVGEQEELNLVIQKESRRK